MEQNNQNNEFEHFLKDSIADFIMIPQRKVWYGIYNHLHPEKKWPSIAVCFCILVAIMHLGILNNKNINTDIQISKNEMLNNQNLLAAQIIKDNTVLLNNNVEIINPKKTLLPKINEEKRTINITPIAVLNNQADDLGLTNEFSKTFSQTNSKNKFEVTIKNVVASENSIAQYETLIATEKTTPKEVENDYSQTKNTKTILQSLTTTANTENKTAIVEKKLENKLENNFATFANMVILPKKGKKKEISYYLTPSVGFRKLMQKDEVKTNGASTNYISISRTNDTYTPEKEDKKAFNVELGASLDQEINKSFKFKTGIQINYTNYISSATHLDHPTQSTVANRSNIPQYKNMDYSSAPGEINLNKSTLQISVPIGVSYSVLGNDNLSLNVAGSIQPSYVVLGSGYVFSADKKYYVSEKDLLNRFNVSAGLETYLSIKTANGVKFNFGPQVRYQLLSTYKSAYNYKENLYNIGVKIGVSTTF